MEILSSIMGILYIFYHLIRENDISVLMCISSMLLHVNVLDCATVFILVLFLRLTTFLNFFFFY